MLSARSKSHLGEAYEEQRQCFTAMPAGGKSYFAVFLMEAENENVRVSRFQHTLKASPGGPNYFVALHYGKPHSTPPKSFMVKVMDNVVHGLSHEL